MEADGDWRVAREGIQLLLNNRITEAEQLFGERKDNVQMAAGYCFVTFMNALMTFEEDKLQAALAALRDVERRCAGGAGWLKAFRARVFGGAAPAAAGGATGGGDAREAREAAGEAERLEQQVILADSQVCVALLTFLQQDAAAYVRGGWGLRKAWRVYQHTYAQILRLYRQSFPTHAPPPGSDFPTWSVVTRDPSQPDLLSPCEWSVPPTPSTPASPAGTPGSPMPPPSPLLLSPPSPPSPPAPAPSPGGGGGGGRGPLAALAALASGAAHAAARAAAHAAPSSPQPPPAPPVPPAVVARLMAAVSFGYGVFQLCASLLPPSLLRLISFLGFEGDRQLGLAALMFARQGRDMRAPLASLALLWYHTIVRPFFALDGANVRAGVEAAQQLIAEAQQDFGQAALFLFFRGRVERLRANVAEALAAFEAAAARSPQREVQLLCLHEAGWCRLIQLDWPAARASFLQLRRRSRWSQAFYAYLAAVCAGAAGDLEEAGRLATAVAGPPPPPGAAPDPPGGNGGGQLEHFVQRRARRLSIATAHVTHAPATQDQKALDADADAAGGGGDGLAPGKNGVVAAAVEGVEGVEGGGADASYCRLLAFELLFLWNALPSCSPQHTARLLEECGQAGGREPMVGLRHLVMGAAQAALGRRAEAQASFRTCLARRAAAPPHERDRDAHVAAFALYELGLLLSRDPQTLEEGRQLLRRAQTAYKAYDFENRLSVRIHAALRRCG